VDSNWQPVEIGPAQARCFQLDGVVCLPGALSPATLALAEALYQWSLAHPGPGAAELPGRQSGSFYQDLANPAALERYRPLVAGTEVGELIAGLWGGGPVWFMYEQVFRKTGGETRRTPWHQDAPYLPVRGAQLAVLWISFDPVTPAQALEFVRGSHQGPLYDGSRFDPDDDTAPLYADGSYPRLPDIEAERERWPIVSWPTEPGDVIVFHPAILHGGGATVDDGQRRTLSLRFFGADAEVAWRPGMQPAEQQGLTPDQSAATAPATQPPVHPLTLMRECADGTPFRHPDFPRVLPLAAADR